jgi:hypothetical protein
MRKLSLCTCVLALVIHAGIASLPAFAANHPHGGHGKPVPTPTPLKPIHEGVIKSITGTSITVGLPGDSKADRSYGIDSGINGMGGTDISIDGVKSSASALKEGMAVSVSGDLSRATSITAHAAPPAQEPAKKENKKGKKK